MKVKYVVVVLLAVAATASRISSLPKNELFERRKRYNLLGSTDQTEYELYRAFSMYTRKPQVDQNIRSFFNPFPGIGERTPGYFAPPPLDQFSYDTSFPSNFPNVIGNLRSHPITRESKKVQHLGILMRDRSRNPITREHKRIQAHGNDNDIVFDDAVSSGPSNCEWAIVSCCSTESTNYPEGCFAQKGCPGPFWGLSPCDPAISQTAAQNVMKYYQNGKT